MRSWVSASNSTHPFRFPRSIRRPLVIAVSLFAVLVMAGGCSSTKSALETPQAEASEVSVLFSVLAPSMDVAVSGDAFTLSIPATSSTAWFTDRPDRNAGSMTVADLVSTWSAQGFDVDPPNAAVAVTVNGEQHQHVVELSNPVLAGGVVTFRAVDVGDDASTDAVAGRGATHEVIAGRFGPTELFIDDADEQPCPSSITTTPSKFCLLAANATVSITETIEHTNLCVIVERTTEDNENVNAGPSTADASGLTLTTDHPVGVHYTTSGEKWKVTGKPNPLSVNFGDCPL